MPKPVDHAAAQAARNVVEARCKTDPLFAERASAGWQSVCDEIEKEALTRRPKPRSFEVHHLIETRRAEYLMQLASEL